MSSPHGLGDAELEELNIDASLEERSPRSSPRSPPRSPRSPPRSPRSPPRSTREKKEEEEEEEQAKKEESKPVEVKKVSPVKKFFSSIRVIVFLVLLTFTVVFCTIVGLVALIEIRKVYEEMDSLDLKERVQNAAHGIVQGTISMTSRAFMLFSDLAFYSGFDEETLASIPETETKLASAIYYGENVVTESSGLNEYDNLPFHLIMAWDKDWNQRLGYYRPCRDVKNRSKCDLFFANETFVNIAAGDMTLAHKEEIPEVFKNIKNIKPHCVNNGVYNCTGIIIVPFPSEGVEVPFFFTLFNIGDLSSVLSEQGLSYPFDDWTFLVATNGLLFSQIAANRTGMFLSVYTSTEDLPSFMEEEFKYKKENNLILDPLAFKTDNVTYVSVIDIDTGKVTLEQDYYSDKKRKYKKVRSDRSITDGYYDHGDEDYVSMSTASLVYKTYKFGKGQIDDETVAFRFEYHDPLTKKHVDYADIMITLFCVLFVIFNALVFLYFNFAFLVPLDRLRKMRADLIKSTLSGLEEDGIAVKGLFGDITDDNALIQANGDEITIMVTLQERMNSLYASIIKSGMDEVEQSRSVSQKELRALRIMNLFMRRDDDALRAILPGLMDPAELARRNRFANLGAHSREAEFVNLLSNAKRAFRSLKSVLNNNIATQFFKSFCIKRGRSSLNSFFFLMDVSWLHQIEAGDRNERDDFLSAMFSDSVAVTPTLGYSSSDKRTSQSSDPIFSMSSESIADRPHRSHFEKGKDSMTRSSSFCSDSSSPSTSPAPHIEEEEAKNVPKSPKLPVAKGSPVLSAQSKPSNVPQFASKISDSIAHFIYECYFGRKSLAQRDMRHAALVGCSQVPDYLNLRDNEKKVTFSPVMFDNLVTAVTKKFTAEVLPQFLNSVSFQIMVYALMITGFFDSPHGHESAKADNSSDQAPSFNEDGLLKGMWLACVNTASKDKKEETKDEDESESSTSSSSSSESDGSDDGDKSKDVSVSETSSQPPAEDDKKPPAEDDKKPTAEDDKKPPAEDDKKQ